MIERCVILRPTDGEDLNARVPQVLSADTGIILRFAVGDHHSNLLRVGTQPYIALEIVLENVG